MTSFVVLLVNSLFWSAVISAREPMTVRTEGLRESRSLITTTAETQAIAVTVLITRSTKSTRLYTVNIHVQNKTNDVLKFAPERFVLLDGHKCACDYLSPARAADRSVDEAFGVTRRRGLMTQTEYEETQLEERKRFEDDAWQDLFRRGRTKEAWFGSWRVQG